MPPSWQDWLPEDDLAWFILDAVAQRRMRALGSPKTARVVVAGRNPGKR